MASGQSCRLTLDISLKSDPFGDTTLHIGPRVTENIGYRFSALGDVGHKGIVGLHEGDGGVMFGRRVDRKLRKQEI